MDAFLGMIQYVAFTYAPSGWEVCKGQLLPIQQNPALYSLLGNRFGGDGINNFGLPDLVDAPSTPKNLLPIICTMGLYPPRP
mgnify:CR=1 FL=1